MQFPVNVFEASGLSAFPRACPSQSSLTNNKTSVCHRSSLAIRCLKLFLWRTQTSLRLDSLSLGQLTLVCLATRFCCERNKLAYGLPLGQLTFCPTPLNSAVQLLIYQWRSFNRRIAVCSSVTSNNGEKSSTHADLDLLCRFGESPEPHEKTRMHHRHRRIPVQISPAITQHDD